MSTQAFTPLHVSDPSIERVIQDIYNKLSQVQRALNGLGAPAQTVQATANGQQVFYTKRVLTLTSTPIQPPVATGPAVWILRLYMGTGGNKIQFPSNVQYTDSNIDGTVGSNTMLIFAFDPSDEVWIGCPASGQSK